MKSDTIALKNRGYLFMEDIERYTSLQDNELYAYLLDEDCIKRSAAIRLLASRGYGKQPEFIKDILHVLKDERCLYTRLEIMHVLQNGDRNSLEFMIPYIATIGNNQYKVLPSSPSKKKSYPLPRDFIARILSKMNIDILPRLMECLDENDVEIIAEVLDAIGFMIFYNQTYATYEYEEKIVSTMNSYKGKHNVIYWKCITCLSAFHSSRVKDILLEIQEHPMEIMRLEAKRSYNYHKEKIT